MKLCTAFGLLSFIFSIPMCIVKSLVFLNLILWMLLFFGASMVPTATGLAINGLESYNNY